MKATQLLAAATLAISSACAFATPVYNGDTTSSSAITGADMNTGYYIWNDAASAQDWHIRWTSTNAVQGNLVDWFGSIVLEGTGLESASSFKFETGGTYGDDLDVDTGLFQDDIQWEAYTNDTGGIDGIDFTIDDDLQLLEFNLGSSLFDNLIPHSGTTNGVASSNIFIGENFDQPNVFIYDSPIGTYQSFEVNVPEPGTLALLGLGLAGLGFARRKQQA